LFGDTPIGSIVLATIVEKKNLSHVQLASFSLSQTNFTTPVETAPFPTFLTVQGTCEEEGRIFWDCREFAVCKWYDGKEEQTFTHYHSLEQSSDIALHHFMVG